MHRPALIVMLMASLCLADAPRTSSVFYPPRMVEQVRHNADASDWGRDIRQRVVEFAEHWKNMSDDELWSLMFGPTLERSWMVWSNGHCPACKAERPMYTWVINGIQQRWKVKCPDCQQSFPTNDFEKFHESGLDAHGVFDHARADRALLFNTEHPDPNDPLHKFGVDDGTGYVEGENRWRFIGAYLVYGQWKQVMCNGVKALAAAYVLTGDEAYAHKAAIMLDRIADLYPGFDYKTQGLVYEIKQADGYVSVWHDANLETRELALAYDAIRPGLESDEQLVAFLAARSERYKTPIRKTTLADIVTNIETRLLRDALENRHKIYSNYPQEELTKTIIHTVLGWPENREQVLDMLTPVLQRATAFDGTTGEKGLANYTSFAAQFLGSFLGYYARIDEQFLPEMHRRVPALPDMWKFFIDTMCLGRYYPLIGDSGFFAAPIDKYIGLALSKQHGTELLGHNLAQMLPPSMYTFLWQLHELTGDPAFVQLLYRENGNTLEGLPYDLTRLASEHARRFRQVLDEHGEDLSLDHVNKQQYCVAILRSGSGDNARALWITYDSGGGHGHADGMNIGLFARGLDLMPDNGYPPVQFGGWHSEKAKWYLRTAAHNTVVVDGGDTVAGSGKTTLWAPGDGFAAITASAPAVIAGQQYERTAALIDINDADAYVLDIFRVVGGSDHAKFFQTHFGEPTVEGLSLADAPDYGHGTLTRAFKLDPAATSGWHADWQIKDHYKLLPDGANVRMRYTDLTSSAAAGTFESWVVAGIFNSTEEMWIPRLLVRRQGEAPLASTFVSVMEPYSTKRAIAKMQRLPLKSSAGTDLGDNFVAATIDLADGRRDTILSADIENPQKHPAPGPNDAIVADDITFRGQLAFVRRDKDGAVTTIAVANAESITAGEILLELNGPVSYIQLEISGREARLIRGEMKHVRRLERNGLPLEVY
jgi:oligo-alginate lyase